MLTQSKQASAPRVPRRSERIRLYEATRLRPNDWSSVEIQVLDISALGLRAECEVRLMRTCFLSTDLPGIGPTHAEVRWQEDGQFGAAFARPIDLSLCSWTPREPAAFVARMLVQRAAAQRDGRDEQEAMLRRQIASVLPMRSLS